VIVNFGSVNIDHVYRVAHMPAPGETLAVKSYEKFLGGKGANQSISIVRAGGEVRHVGAVGPDGGWVVEQLEQAGVATSHLNRVDAPTGHAVIAVDDAGENQILICSGANLCLTEQQIEAELRSADQGAWVLLQNETNLTQEIVKQARRAGCKVAYSAAPFVAEDTLALIDQVDLVCVNAVEAAALADALGCAIADVPCPMLLVTRGSDGSVLFHEGNLAEQTAFEVTAVDTTGAGDTFLGAFLARYVTGDGLEQALQFASAASALQVTRPGAAAAIPARDEVEQFLKERGK
jgi:ribokinase